VTVDAGRIFVVDDDAGVRKALERLLRAAGRASETFASADAVIERLPHERPSCLVLDVRLPGLSGIDLQRELTRNGSAVPIVFITGHGDVTMGVEAMKAGAVDFLQKPFDNAALLEAIDRAVDRHERHRGAEAQVATLRARFASLTPREREVCDRVASGLRNRQIADELQISEKTVKVHRSRVMEKMHAGSLAGLVRMARELEVAQHPAGPMPVPTAETDTDEGTR